MDLGIGTDTEATGEGSDDLVATARVLTDYRFYATAFDVIVATERPGDGHDE